MSIALPDVDLTSAIVGTTGTIDLSRVGVGAGGVSASPSTLQNQATLFIFNDSGCKLTMTFAQTGNSFGLPAGAWTYYPLPSGEYQIKWHVDLLLANAPINVLITTYYAPGEPIPSSFTLGNSPIGGAVSTGGPTVVTATNLVNIGNPANTNVIDIEQTGSTGSNTRLDNSGNLIVSQYMGGVLTTLFRIIAGQPNGSTQANSNVLISDANHVAEILGVLWCDSVLHASGQIYTTAAENNLGGIPAIYINGLGTNASGNYGALVQAITGDIGSSVGYQANGISTLGAGSAAFKAVSQWSAALDCTLMNSPSSGVVLGANNNPGIDLSRITAAGAAIKFAVGSLSRIALSGPYTVNNGAGQQFAHNLGVTPDFAWPIQGGATNANFSISEDFAGRNATTIGLATSNATPVGNVYLFAGKF